MILVDYPGTWLKVCLYVSLFLNIAFLVLLILVSEGVL